MSSYRVRHYVKGVKEREYTIISEHVEKDKTGVNKYLRKHNVPVDSFKGVDVGCVHIGNTQKIDWTILSG